MSTQISWDAIEAITHGRLGRTMATCPLCSETRRTPQKRHNKVLAVNLLEPDFAVFFAIIAKRRATVGRIYRRVLSILPNSNAAAMRRNTMPRKKSRSAAAKH